MRTLLLALLLTLSQYAVGQPTFEIERAPPLADFGNLTCPLPALYSLAVRTRQPEKTTIQVTFSPLGNVTAVEVTESSGDVVNDRAALIAFSRCRPKPGGEPIPMLSASRTLVVDWRTDKHVATERSPPYARCANPPYPTIAAVNNAEGTSKVSVDFGQHGFVVAARLAQSAQNPDLDMAALSAAAACRLPAEPGQSDKIGNLVRELTFVWKLR
jgi:TonB family protein